jgi:AhpD family alkylhydroperoxidase
VCLAEAASPRTKEGQTMKERVDVAKVAPGAYKAMLGLQGYVNKSGLEPSLLELIKIRASQINGCASCLAMHVREAAKAGESHERMHLLNAWDEAPIYTARERAALAWTEAVTLVTDGHVPDETFEEARKQFSEQELVDLTVAVVAINGWNRLAIAFRRLPQVEAALVNSA